MQLKKKVSINGDWAKALVDIKDGDILTLLDAGQTTSGKFGEQTVFKVRCKTGDKILALNQTSINNLIDEFGEDTASWAGNMVRAFVIKMRVQKGMTNVIFLAGVDWTMDNDGNFVKINVAGGNVVDVSDEDLEDINKEL